MLLASTGIYAQLQPREIRSNDPDVLQCNQRDANRAVRYEFDRFISGIHETDGTSPDWVVVDIGTTDYTAVITGAGSDAFLDSTAANATADSFHVYYGADTPRIHYIVIKDR